MNNCPLCLEDNCQHYFDNTKKSFYKCNTCKMIFTSRECLLEADEENKIYDRHENDPNDIHYVNFMERILTPIREYLPPNSSGLDFGCGPGPVIKSVLSKEGYSISEYDPFYFNDKRLLEAKYDFVISTEVIEHIYDTKIDLELMLSMLKEKGVLGIMTSFYPSGIDKFKRWGYHQDPTHVRFFNEETFEWIALKYNLELIIPRKNVAIFKKV